MSDFDRKEETDMDSVQKCIQKISEFTGLVAGLTNEKAQIIYCSDERLLNKEDQQAKHLLLTDDAVKVGTENCYARIEIGEGEEAACFIQGADQQSLVYLQLFHGWLSELLHTEGMNEKRIAFLKNVLLENELPGDIPLKSRECRIPYQSRRLVMQLHLPSYHQGELLESMKALLPNRKTDYILLMDEHTVLILLEITEDYREMVQQFAHRLLELFQENERNQVIIGIGMPADSIKQCAKSYREASLALTVGLIFEPTASVMWYDQLGLGRLVYQLPNSMCQLFLEEVFPDDCYQNLDAETLETIDKFFENNLNGSETARQLFVHRNTLVYRLDKVEKLTNLDLRKFEDAVLFKVASMVRTYLKTQPKQGKSMLSWKRKY